MPFTKIFLTLAFIFICFISMAQVIDNMATFKHINSPRYFRLQYDNDFFTAKDEYYTQGINLEWVHPAFKKNPLNKIFIQPRNSEMTYGLRSDHAGYTPSSISSDFILYGDRPFSANLSVNSFLISIDTLSRSRLSSGLTVGMIGSRAKGKEMQIAIHKWLDNIMPMGWQYQIANDVILNYQINYEKQLWHYRHVFLVNSNSELKVGTHTNKIKTGINFMLGNLINPYGSNFETQHTKKALRYYLYGQIQPGLTLYDATLQGGLFNKTSPYTISSTDITRLTYQADFGLVVKIRTIYLEYSQSFITKEYKTGNLHRWGGVRMGIDF